MGTAEDDVLRVVVVGAGLAGCLSAVLLARLGESSGTRVHVVVLEYRDAPRPAGAAGTTGQPRGRSINLALSTRGLSALDAAGLGDSVRALGVPMHGRLVHHARRAPAPQPYGHAGQFLLSVSRAELNRVLLDACADEAAVDVRFRAKVTDVDFDAGLLSYLQDERTCDLTADLIVGADGTFSRVRAAMERRVPRFDTSREHIAAGYKELTISRESAEAGRLPKEYLHVWPRHEFMLIALPNIDGSFTSTLFMDAANLEELQLKGREAVSAFFMKEFPDAVDLLPDVSDQFLLTPASPLLTVRCKPYNYRGRAVLIGDAAHAIVPFYGQGCNAAFEDCVLLRDSLARHGLRSLEKALEAYADDRKKDADAIADLAIEHYNDMASKSASGVFAFRRRLEIRLNRWFPGTFMPLYSMVTFSTIPYATAVHRAKRQDQLIAQGLGVALGIGALAAACAGISVGLTHVWEQRDLAGRMIATRMADRATTAVLGEKRSVVLTEKVSAAMKLREMFRHGRPVAIKFVAGKPSLEWSKD